MSEETEPMRFPTDRLPATMAAMVRESARVNRVPDSLPGCVALATLSASLGAGLRMERGAGKFTRGNIMVLVGAESGTGKSEVFADIAAPLSRAEAELRDGWKDGTRRDLLTEKDTADDELAKLRKELRGSRKPTARSNAEIIASMKEIRARLETIEEELKREPRLIVEEITEEKLAVIAEGQQLEAVASFSSDARQVYRILTGKYSKTGTADSLLLKMFTGEYATIDRMGRPGVNLRAPCLTSLWLLQPDLVKELFANDGFNEGGFLARLLVCDSGAEPMEMPEHVAPINEAVAGAWSGLVSGNVARYRLADAPEPIVEEPAAAEAFRQCYNEIVARRRADLRDLNAYASRWAEMAQRLAVVLHAGDHGDQAHKRALPLETAERAVDLARWFAGEQLRQLADRREGKRATLRDRVVKLALKSLPQPLTAKALYRGRIARNAGDARQILAEMAGEGIFRIEEIIPERGGTPSILYHLKDKPDKGRGPGQ